MGLPGALPVLNEAAVDCAVLAGLALNCTVSPRSSWDRKNYFYPDLPRAYQITQWERPICRDGFLEIDTEAGTKRIGITRIHLEEDAGKLIHSPEKTEIDCNRCGVPLIELVSEPDLRSAEEAKAYLQALRTVLRYVGVSDCRMNEGAFRCDVNLSVRPVGDPCLGVRTELKNLNSFAFVGKAIEYEAARQIALLEQGEPVIQETRRFDPSSGKTLSMRSKEDAMDYRYFPEPDLPPVVLSETRVDTLRASLPLLPRQRKERYQATFGLSDQACEILCADRLWAEFFEACAAKTDYPKLLANLFLTDLKRLCVTEEFSLGISPVHMAELSDLVGTQTVNSSTAKWLIEQMVQTDESPRKLVEEKGLAQINDPTVLLPLIRQVLAENPKSVADYQNGKRAAAKALMGRVMGATGGKANPRLLSELLEQELGDRQ